ncbi:MAG TPA: glycosyltransferase family 4 protein [Anaerolineae bacterium]|nr:glycosyltransferase family 4 protein [Anaerolineae bacterium]HQH39322.1 glycosyltransferase family 4 protein [Anaerolineae bacterium]
MRIGLITGEYPPLEGGVGDFTRELGIALTTAGHEVHILTTRINTQPSGPAQEDGVTIYRDIRIWNRSAYPRITDWINTLALDVVNIQYQATAYQMRGWINLYPRRQKRYLTAPIVVTFHDLLPPYLFPKAGRLRQWTVWQLAQYADGIIITNSNDYNAITADKQRVLPPMRLIPIGSNIAPHPPAGYNREVWRREHGFGPTDLLIGFFGFMNRSKGIETLLEALKQLLDRGLPAHLLFIGGRTGSSDSTNTRYADEIDALIEQKGLNNHVHRTGFTMPAEVSAALLAVDMCALPYRDGASMRHGTLHAALTHGRAVITTTPQVETPQLQNGVNILLVPPGNAGFLASVIQALWDNPQARAEIEQKAAQLSQDFLWERIAAHTVEFFNTAIKRRSGESA